LNKINLVVRKETRKTQQITQRLPAARGV